MLSELLYRLRALFRRKTLEGELDDELQFHLEKQIDKYLKSGLDRPEAVRRTRLTFGGLEQVKEECREARGVFILETLIQDLGYAIRRWFKNPGFALSAVTAIGLGIGVNTAVFTIANAVLFKSIGFDGTGQIVYAVGSEPGCELPCDTGRSYPDFLEFSREVKAFEALVAYGFRAVNVSDKSAFPEHYMAMEMSSNGFSVLGRKPLLGRDFIPADEEPGAARVAMLGYDLWEKRYEKAPSIIGKSIRVNEVPTVVIGVMPPEVRFGVDMWVPLIPVGDWQKREYRGLMMFGRLVRGANLRSAGAEMETVSQRLETEYPFSNKGVGIQVLDAKHYFYARVRLIFVALWIAVGFVLLVACANVANLLLAQAVARSREVSVRMALGAGRWRVIRQLLVESVTLSTAGGLVGWLIANWSVRAFVVAIPDKPPGLEFTMDPTVFGYLAVISVGAGILFGLAPALRLSKLDVHLTLKEGGHGATAGSRGRYLTGLLVVSQMALTVTLLVGAGLMIRLFLSTYRSQMGVNTTNVLTMHMDLPHEKYPRSIDQVLFYERLQARLQALPGVEIASIASSLPGHDGSALTYELEGAPPIDPRQRPHVGGLMIGPEYFRTLDVGLLLGRVFADSDGQAGVSTVIVNHTFATKAWPGEDNPLGKRLRLASEDGTQPWLTVVGVVPDVFQNDMIRGQFDPLIYLPYRQQPQSSMFLVARTRIVPGTLGNAFRREVQALDENLPVAALRTLDEDVKLRDWPIRVFGTLFASFATIALLLAAVGLYAVVAHWVNGRRQEIGVRLAMGATTADVLGMVLKQGMRQVALGLGLGLAAAFVLTRVLGSLLAGVGQANLTMFLTVALVLVGVGMLACAIPARRATRVDPVVALRCE